MPYGPGSNALITNALPPTGDTVEEAINKLDAQFDALYDALNAAEQQVDVQFRGEWAESTTYQCNDVVTSGGATYICKSETGAPAGTAVTDTTYWGVVTNAAEEIEFATAEEIAAGTVTDKAIAPSALKPELDEINELITAIKTKINTGTVNNAVTANSALDSELFDGQLPDYYRCTSGCSWTCMTGCAGGCGNGCTGSCMAGCTGGCSSCTGTCTGSCSTGCSNTCIGSCTGTCTSCRGCTGCGNGCMQTN